MGNGDRIKMAPYRNNQYANLFDEDDDEDFLQFQSQLRARERFWNVRRMIITGVGVLIFICFIITVVACTRKTSSSDTYPSHISGISVKTKPCGFVQGIVEHNVYIFKGIPYAKPPVEELRWQRPFRLQRQDGSCWENTLLANKFGSQCFQKNPITEKFEGSEDCLFLNIWTPKIDDKARLPVMVWFHGGYLMFGNSSMPTYSPTAKLAKQANMVFVSMNYRLNVFGFLTLDIFSQIAPGGKSGNYGLFDQILALNWIKQNIANFGGDPTNITIFGHSSGGTSIFTFLASPEAKNLFHRAWIASGSPILNKTNVEANEDNKVFLQKSGCKDTKCLSKMKPEDLYQSLPLMEYPHWEMTDLMGLPIKGHFDGALLVVDGEIVRKPPFEVWAKKKETDVPVLISNTAQEVNVLPEPLNLKSWNWSTYSDVVSSYLDAFGDNITEQSLQFYPITNESTPELQYSSMVTDVRAICPTDLLAHRAASTFSSPIFRLITTSVPSKPISFLHLPYNGTYAFHGWDLLAFFGSINSVIENPTPEDLAFQVLIQENVFHFARTGLMKEPLWFSYPNTTALISNEIHFVDSYHKEQCEFWIDNGFESYAWIN